MLEAARALLCHNLTQEPLLYDDGAASLFIITDHLKGDTDRR
jgi:hypothetical protein